jgi:NDP-sugar pyrophosphorylase family protein
MQAASPAIGIINLSNVGRYGQVHLDSNNRIVGFLEKTNLNESGWINAGLYCLNEKCFSGWRGQAFSLERELFVDLVKRGSLSAVPLKADFIDIGVPKDYYRFCRWVGEERRFPLCD